MPAAAAMRSGVGADGVLLAHQSCVWTKHDTTSVLNAVIMPARAQIPLPHELPLDAPPPTLRPRLRPCPRPLPPPLLPRRKEKRRDAGRSNHQIEWRPDPSATVAQGSRASDDAAVPVCQGPSRRCFCSAMAMELPPNPRSWTGRGRLLFQGKKDSVLLTRMESITSYKNQHGQPTSGCHEHGRDAFTADSIAMSRAISLAPDMWVVRVVF
ncbi:uncharacterized protein LOC125520775 [Triticum urartu]|uniref:uncharacterized protein LOC125520775 n=1 Tax=Triticum urartu TaxID=4572 RepID=UPI0020437944|nr:uncharacterized protein LOC125520775 [Triticum urartu]